MKNSVSKPVLAFLAVGLALIAVLVWFGIHSREKVGPPPSPDAASPIPAQDSVSNSPPESVPSVVKTADGLPQVIPISLTNVLDDADRNAVPSDAAVPGLPGGTQTYGGIEFWLQGLTQLQGQGTRDQQHQNFRTQVVVPLDETNSPDGGVPLTQRGSNIATIYVLGATRFSTSKAGETFATMVLHYADDSTARKEIKYNVDLRDWWRTPYEDPAQLPNPLTRVAWRGPNPVYKDQTLRLYRIAFVNPHPEKVMRSIEFISAMANPSLFVAALTLDPLLPGLRPDDLTSAEAADPELPGRMQLFVQDSTGKPLTQAQVSASFSGASSRSPGQKYTTDNTGMALVRYPGQGLETLDVSASKNGFSGRKMLWDVKAGDTVPATYTLKLAPELTIGGTVVDGSKNPIAGATISLYRFWSGDEGDPSKKGEQPSFSNQEQTTDDQGRWQAKGLPAGLLDHIGFDVNHPDFVGTNITVGANSATEKQLRDGTHIIALQHGFDVHGWVIDGNEVPVSGATLWAGQKYTRERKNTKSDDHGQFSFHSVRAGDVLFSVMARNFSADNKTLNVHENMSEIVFKLKPGSVIRAHVQDESGQPVADARVGLGGDVDSRAYDAYDYSANTDSQGNFAWDGAPNETMKFYFFHDGFEAKRDVQLAPNQDNTVTLRRTRQLAGQVLDAITEQPVTNFTVRSGQATPNGSYLNGIIRFKDFSAADGHFTMDLEEEEDDAIIVYAADYADKIEKLPEAQNGTVEVVVHLTPSASLSGTVLAPDGTPAPGVSVCAANGNGNSFVQLTGGRLHSYDMQSKIATTDADGHFKIPSAPDDGLVVAAGDPGFARAPLAEVRSSGVITLQPWGRIEGTLKIGGQPGVGKDLLFNLSIPGIGTDFNGYKSTTDDQGQFTMEKVPPGEGAIVRLIQTSPNSWSHSDSSAVTVKPGETTQVTLGDTGAVLVGRMRFDNPPTNDAALNFQGNLSMPMPQHPPFNSPEEATAYFKSPEWQALAKLQKNYSLEIKPDGSFEVDNVAPGVYSLNISARLGGQRSWEHPPLAQGQSSVTVPDSFDPAAPIDVGEVVLKPIPPH